MAGRARNEIDPQLPYIQVHRSVGPRAARLALSLGLPYPHVRGGLDIFWEDLSERRVLRKGLERPLGPAIILTRDELLQKLRLAFGVDLQPEPFIHAGFLEEAADGFRVRGMSRQMDVEAKRLRATGWAPPEVVVRSGSARAQHHLSPPLSPCSAPPQPPPEPVLSTTEVRGERREVRVEEKLPEFPQPDASVPTVDLDGEQLDDAMKRVWREERGSDFDWRMTRDGDALRTVLGLAKGSHTEVLRVFRRALRQSFPRCRHVKDLADNWSDYAGTDPPAAAGKGRAPESAKYRSGEPLEEEPF